MTWNSSQSLRRNEKVETWKVIWEIVFFVASGLFYAIALYVAVRASGDVAGFVAGAFTRNESS